MLKSGCTAVYDLFTAMPLMTQESAEAVIQAYTDVGLRAVLAPSMSDLVFYRAVPGLIALLPPIFGNRSKRSSPPRRIACSRSPKT